MKKIIENEKEITKQIIKILSENNLSCKDAEELLRYIIIPALKESSKIISE